MQIIKKILLLLVIFTGLTFSQNGGYAVKFNGTDGYATATMNTGNTNSTATFEMWFTQLTAQAGTQYLADFRSVSGTNNRRVMPFLNNSVLGIYCAPNTGNDNNAITQSTGITVSQNAWYHIAVTINGPTLNMYVNGKLYVTTSLTDTYSLTGTEVLTIATDYGNTVYANIKADEVRVWSTERSVAEIKTNMYKELAGNEAGLLSYYKMSNGSGASLSDNQISGSYGGVLSGGYTWVASGAFADNRNALDFDGSNDYVDCGNSASVQRNGTQSFTLEAWVKPTGGIWVSVISKFVHTASNEGYSIEIFSDNRVSLLIGNNWSNWTAVTSNASLSAGVWSHIAATYDGSVVKIYINGLLMTVNGTSSQSIPWTDGVTDSGTNLLLGSRSGTTFYSGQMDEARVWTVARTQAEIQENMCHTLVGNEAGLAAYYRLDQIDGSVTYDLTSNANNGTLTNMALPANWVVSDAFDTWIGAESSAWAAGGNWSKGTAPTSSNSAGIYKWALGSEATITTSPTLNNLFISSTSSPTLSSSATINMNLILRQDFNLNGQTVTLGSVANLVEGSNRLYGTSGTITTTRNLSNISALDVAGLGAKITTAANMGSTTITRGHAVQTGNSNSSIKRYYDITPTNNSSLNASLVFNYNDAELNSLTESNFSLYRSTDAGSTWIAQGGTPDAVNNFVSKTGIASFSRWTIGDTSLPLGGPPDTPVATAATGATTTSFSANWGAAAGATKYYLDVSTNNTFSSFVTGFNDLDVGNVVTYSVTSLTPGITYYYRVRAYNASGTSSSSNTITVITSLSAPVATAATSVTAATLSANWNAVTGATGYYLDVATNNTFTTFVAGFNNKNVSNITTYSVTGLSGNTTYYYRVRSYTASATSISSNTITTLTPPAAPVALEATLVFVTGFTANWNTTAGAVNYRIDVSDNAGFTTFAAGYNNFNAGTVTTLNITGLTVNTPYYYRVRASNAGGTSANSNIIAVGTAASAPVLSKLESAAINYAKKQSNAKLTDSLDVQSPATCPILFAEITVATNYVKGEDQILFTNTTGVSGSWDNEIGKLIISGSASAESYKTFLRSVQYTNVSLHPSLSSKLISFVVNNGFFNSNILYRSININTGNLPPVLSGLETTPLEYLKGISPLRILITGNSVVEDNDNMFLASLTVKISQGYIKNEDYLDFENTSYLSGVFNQETGILTVSGHGTPADFQNFLRNIQYRNSNGANATTSNKLLEIVLNDGLVNSIPATRQLNVKSNIEKPTLLAGTIVNNRVNLTWQDNAAGEGGFLIERSENNNTAFVEIARVGANSTGYADASIINGRRYYYRVAAYSGAVKSDYSNEFSIVGIVVGISDLNGTPKGYVVSQNYPNPFNPSTSIVYGLPYESKVRIQVYNSLGQMVDDLVNETKGPGVYNVRWDASALPSGVYLYRVSAVSIDGSQQFNEIKRMVFIK